MFHHEGPSRSAASNRVLAGYLALNAGFVNSGGFVLLGAFTSHVTGSVGRFGNDLAGGDFGAALFSLGLVASFFAGAFLASLLVEARFREVAHGYGLALLAEALLLAVFVAVAGGERSADPRVLDAEEVLLCLAMGMQNSLVTRLSGAVVRTTHLTGVVTDLGIEAARWYRWQRSKWRELPPLLPARDQGRPSGPKLMLLLTITVAFVVGSMLGATLTSRVSHWSMAAPSLLALAASVYAFAVPRGRREDEIHLRA